MTDTLTYIRERQYKTEIIVLRMSLVGMCINYLWRAIRHQPYSSCKYIKVHTKTTKTSATIKGDTFAAFATLGRLVNNCSEPGIETRTAHILEFQLKSTEPMGI